MVELTCLGAAHTVTGCKYLLYHGARRVLVDCGLVQGPKQLRFLNWDDCPVPPASTDAVALTPAHAEQIEV